MVTDYSVPCISLSNRTQTSFLAPAIQSLDKKLLVYSSLTLYLREIKHTHRETNEKQTIKNVVELQYHATEYYLAWQYFGILTGD